MLHQETKDLITYYSSFEQQELLRTIAEMENEISCLGEMSESSRLGYAPHGPSQNDCEIRISELQKHLEIAKQFDLSKPLIKVGERYHLDSGLIAKIEGYNEKTELFSGSIEELGASTWWNKEGENRYFNAYGVKCKSYSDHTIVEKVREC